jgi:hypothetical protein
MKRRLTIGLGAATAAGALALVLAAPHLAFAQDPTPSPSSGTSAAPGAGRPDRAQHQDDLATALAQELGIDKDKVAAALAKIDANRPKPPADANPPSEADRTAALKSRLDAAVKAGTITQAEEDAILKASAAGVLGGPGGHGGPGRPGGASGSGSGTGTGQ